MTCRELISDTISMLRSADIDDYIPGRFILSEARSIVADFIRKSADARKNLYRLSEGWSEIPCLYLEEVSAIQCNLDVRDCSKLMKSTRKLPDTYTASYGDILQFVSSPNLEKFINFSTPRTWASLQKREFKDKTQYYYFFIDGYFYIPIPKNQEIAIEEIRLQGYFKDKYEVYLFNKELENCKTCKDECPKLLDFQFVCPFYLENDVKKELLNKLTKIYKSLVQDEYPNMNSNDKNSQRDIQNSAQGNP